MGFSLLVISLALLVTGSASATTYHVALSGDDRNPGTIEQPFASIAKAKEVLRNDISAGLTEDAEIILGAGTYRISEPLTFDAGDGGTEDFRVTYRANEGAQVSISGGKPITGWKAQDRNQWTVEIPEAAKGAWPFRDLYCDGQRLPRGRFPNAPELLRVSGVSEDLTGIVLNESPDVGNLAGSNAELVMYQNWSVSRVLITSSSDRTLKMKNPMGWVGHGDFTSASTNKPTYIENALAFVDTPGEWYLDTERGILTYQAQDDEDPNTREFIAPLATQLVSVQGSTDTAVRNLHFAGITFEHTLWSLPDFGYLGIQAGHYGTSTREPTYVLPLGLQFIYAESCSVSRSRIARMGACGVGFGAGTRRNRLENCQVEDIGGNGIMVGWRGVGELARETDDEDGHLSADWANPGDVPMENVVNGNMVERCGAVNHGCVGIFDAFAQASEITHNVVRDMPYTGISSGFRWNETGTSQRGGLVAYNHVYDTMKMLADGACLYTLGSQPGARIIGNVFHTVHRSAYAHGGAPNNGIFFDQGSKGFLVEGNTIYDTSGDPIRFNQCTEDAMTWKDNQFGVGP